MVNFVLDSLSSSVTMDICGTIHSADIVVLDTSATAVFEVSLDAMKDVFKFQTDSNDIQNQADADIKYQIDLASWPELNPANAMMHNDLSVDPIASSNTAGTLPNNKMLVAHDFVRYLALKLFNTHYGVDLFDNELELLNDLRYICGNTAEGQTWYDLMTKITAVSKSGDHADLAGDAGSKYMTNATDSSDNLCKVLFDQMMLTEKARFADIATGADDFQSLPFIVGDTISFKLTIAPAAGQEELTGVEAFAPRSYRIVFSIVEAPVNTEVAEDEPYTAPAL